jgi:ribosomal-protein-alanine N-acetyltransferase
MTTAMPPLTTERLVIRPLTLDDFDAIHHLIDIDLKMGTKTQDERRRWLEWSILNHEQLALLYQPPYGERAVVLKASGLLIGAVGFVQSYIAAGKLPYYQSLERQPFGDSLHMPELGLYYAFASAFQRQGYATEAVRGMIDYAFKEMNVRRIVATTEFDNDGSMGVMRRVGMRIEKNPTPGNPPYLQVVGILENERS